MRTITMIGISGPPPDGAVYPQFRNDRHFARIRIGVRKFECAGRPPPRDHPHVYLEIGLQGEIHCPHCGTWFEFDPGLDAFAAIPMDPKAH